MSALLRLAAVVCLAWAALQFGVADMILAAPPLAPRARAVANGFAIANLALACVFWYGARAPQAQRGTIYAALLLMGLRTANALYEVLILLPGNEALLSLADLVLSLALLVGILEALPRTLGGSPTEGRGST